VVGFTLRLKLITLNPELSTFIKSWDIHVLRYYGEVIGFAFDDLAFLVIDVPATTYRVSSPSVQEFNIVKVG
jgi:hypothetical protein